MGLCLPMGFVYFKVSVHVARPRPRHCSDLCVSPRMNAEGKYGYPVVGWVGWGGVGGWVSEWGEWNK